MPRQACQALDQLCPAHLLVHLLALHEVPHPVRRHCKILMCQLGASVVQVADLWGLDIVKRKPTRTLLSDRLLRDQFERKAQTSLFQTEWRQAHPIFRFKSNVGMQTNLLLLVPSLAAHLETHSVVARAKILVPTSGFHLNRLPQLGHRRHV